MNNSRGDLSWGVYLEWFSLFPLPTWTILAVHRLASPQNIIWTSSSLDSCKEAEIFDSNTINIVTSFVIIIINFYFLFFQVSDLISTKLCHICIGPLDLWCARYKWSAVAACCSTAVESLKRENVEAYDYSWRWEWFA